MTHLEPKKKKFKTDPGALAAPMVPLPSQAPKLKAGGGSSVAWTGSSVAGISDMKDTDDVTAFGAKNPPVKKKLVVGVLHFLDNDDLYNQSLGNAFFAHFTSEMFCSNTLVFPSLCSLEALVQACTGQGALGFPRCACCELGMFLFIIHLKFEREWQALGSREGVLAT
jgi:hypothetical protein